MQWRREPRAKRSIVLAIRHTLSSPGFRKASSGVQESLLHRMARLSNYSFSVRDFCFFLTLGLVASCVAALPAGRESARAESTTSDPTADASSDDPSSLWDVFDGLDIDGNAWLSQSSSPSAVTKNSKRSSSSFRDDDYDYDDYDDNLLNDDEDNSDEDGGNMFLSFPRKAMNFKDKQDDESDSDEDEKTTFRHGANSLVGYSDDFGRDDENMISKSNSLGPVSVVEDEGGEEDVIFASNDDDDDDDDDSEVSIPMEEKKNAVHKSRDDDDDDSDDQTFGDPEIEGVETIYNDHIFLF